MHSLRWVLRHPRGSPRPCIESTMAAAAACRPWPPPSESLALGMLWPRRGTRCALIRRSCPLGGRGRGRADGGWAGVRDGVPVVGGREARERERVTGPGGRRGRGERGSLRQDGGDSGERRRRRAGESGRRSRRASRRAGKLKAEEC